MRSEKTNFKMDTNKPKLKASSQKYEPLLEDNDNSKKSVHLVEDVCSGSSSCSSYSSNASNCSCHCCCTTSTCSPSCSDSDSRFDKYYQLSSDDEIYGESHFPKESKPERKAKVKLLLHTMVMWDEIWKTRNTSDDTSSSDEDYDNKKQRKVKRQIRKKPESRLRFSEANYVDTPANQNPKAKGQSSVNFKRTQSVEIPAQTNDHDMRYQEAIEMEEDLVATRRLKQALDMTEDSGVFFSGQWYGQPLEEVDPFIYDDTFCVLGWRPQTKPCVVYRYHKGNSLGIFPPEHPVRRFAFKVTTHRYFGWLIALTVLANCITLAMDEYKYDEFGNLLISDLAVSIEFTELAFLIIYTVEMMLKIISKGFIFQRMAYLRNGWNVVDFTVVLLNYIALIFFLLPYIMSEEYVGEDMEFLRIFRVFRAVKTVNIFPGLRHIVNSLINSSGQLFEVLGLTVFAITILSLIGMELFGGRFLQKCVRIQGESNEDGMDPEFRGITRDISSYMTDRLYGMWIENEHNWFYRDEPDSEPVPCGNSSTARSCPEGFVCIEVTNSKNPNNGWISFDNFFLAAMQTLQVMTLDYWDRIYELALSTVGHGGATFFIVVIFFGGHYILNLMLAVVTLSYEKEQSTVDVNENKAFSIPRRLQLTRQMSSFNFEHLNQQRFKLFEGFRNRPSKERDELLLRMIKANLFAHHVQKLRFENTLQITATLYKLLQKQSRYKHATKSQAELQQMACLNEHMTMPPEDECVAEYQLFQGSYEISLANSDVNCLQLSNGKTCNFNIPGFDQTFVVLEDMSKFVKWPGKDTHFDLYLEEPKWVLLHVWLSAIRNATQPIVEDWKWMHFMTLCTFINTVISCCEHHMQPNWLDNLIYYSNDIFTIVFCFEIILKGLAYQNDFFDYGWNKFDLFVVVGSISDNILQITLGYKGFRGLKLLRILKLAQAWDIMKIMLNILFSAMTDMAKLLLILCITIFIFAVFGMQYIGVAYSPREFNADYYPANYPRFAWQTVFHSFIMVFRVVCGEWVELLWECTEALRADNDEYKCFFTFIPILFFGNFIVLNLFLAMLLHIFDADEINKLSKSVKSSKRGKEVGLRIFLRYMGKKFKEKVVKLYSKRKIIWSKVMQNTVTPDSSEMPTLNNYDQLQNTFQQSSDTRTRMLNDIELGTLVSHITEPPAKLRLYVPRRLPKWRVYKVVLRYRDVISGKITNELDLEDGDFKTAAEELSTGDIFETSEIDDNYRKNRKFREVAYKVILGIRKAAGKDAILRFIAYKEREIRESCLLGETKKKQSHLSVHVHTQESVPIDPKLVPHCFNCRAKVLLFVNHKYYEWFALFLIFSSSILLCFDDAHLPEHPLLADALFYVSLGNAIVFFLEFLLKVFALGFRTYFTCPWTLLDFILVTISVASVIIDLALRKYIRVHEFDSSAMVLKALLSLRALRPLRVISRWHGLKVVVTSLVHALPAIFNVFCVCLTFWLMFAITGVQFFKGRFYKCVNEFEETVDPSIAPNKQVCCQKAHSHKFAWVNTFPNFDSVPGAYISLFYLASFDGWIELITVATDARDVDQQPLREFDTSAHLYFISFCLFGGFLTTNLFVGVIIDNFNMLKKKFDGNVNAVLTSQLQLKYYWSLKKLGGKRQRVVIPKPLNPARLAFFEISTSQRSEYFMFIIIGFNMIALCYDSYGKSTLQDSILEALNAFFIFLYTFEAIVKIIGQGKFYLTSGWNMYDLFVLITSSVDYALGDLLTDDFPISPSVIRLFRILRVARIFRLVKMKSASGIRRLLFSFLVSIPALFNVVALLLLVMFVYSVLGMYLFGRMFYRGVIDEFINFDTFPNAFLLLFRLTTLSGWSDVLNSIVKNDIDCGEIYEQKCGGPDLPECPNWIVGIVFMVSYVLITNFVIVNTYIAIILENFQQATKEDELDISGDDIDMFYAKWAVFDGDATQFMELKYLPPFLNSLEPPLRMRYPNQISITALDLPIYQGFFVHVQDVLRNLVVFVLGHADTEQMNEVQDIVNSKFSALFRQRRVLPLVSTTRIWKIQHKAAFAIQLHWRKIRKRKPTTHKKTFLSTQTVFKSTYPQRVDKINLNHTIEDETVRQPT